MTAKNKYKVTSQAEGRGPVTTHRFTYLSTAQLYIKDRWEGVEYMDGWAGFHNDYTSFELHGFTLREVGERGAYGTDAYWDWTWFTPEVLAVNECALEAGI